MMSAGRAHQQARRTWTALGTSEHADALLILPRELAFLSSGAATVASGLSDVSTSANFFQQVSSYKASCSGQSEPANVCSRLIEYLTEHCMCNGTMRSAALEVHGPRTATGQGVAWRTGLTASALWPSSRPSGSAPAPLHPLGHRAYHPWYYGSKLRNQSIFTISSLDGLADLIRQQGENLDHINLVVLLRQLQLLRQRAAGQAAAQASSISAAAAKAAAATGTATVATAVEAAAARAVQQQVELLAANASKLVRKRTKWYDPRNACAVVYLTAALGYTDRRLLHNMTARMMARLNEAYSRDLLLLLRGLRAHAKLSAAAQAAADSSRTDWDRAQRPRQEQAVTGPGPQRPYRGPPHQLLESVEHFLLAKIPTGRVPPEKVAGLILCLRQSTTQQRPLNPKLLATAETDLRVRLSIYAPKPLADMLASLASERHQVAPDLLDAAADQFAAHAEQRGTGTAAARFLAAATALIQRRAREGAALPAPTPAAGAGAAAAEGATAPDGAGSGVGGADGDGGGRGGRRPSPGRWLLARPELLAQCLKLMGREAARVSPEVLAEWLAVLIRAEVPLASLVSPFVASSPATTASVSASAVPALGAVPASATPAAAAAGAAAPAMVVARPSALVAAASLPGAAAAAAAAAAFVRSHSEAVEAAAPSLSREVRGKLRKVYDNTGLPYPKGL